MTKKNIAIALALLFATSSVFACSSSSSSGYSCPTVGEKSCPNDTPATQADVTLCNKCLSQNIAVAQCANLPEKTSCNSAGMSEAAPTLDQATVQKCETQANAAVQCLVANAGDGC